MATVKSGTERRGGRTRLSENMGSQRGSRPSASRAANKLEKALLEGQHAEPVRFTRSEAAEVSRCREAHIIGDPDNQALRDLAQTLLLAD